MQNEYYVYILTNYEKTTFYIGVTNDLPNRILEHKNKAKNGLTSNYDLTKLVYFETAESSSRAVEREKQLKKWHREWKIRLIQKTNPDFKDLSHTG